MQFKLKAILASLTASLQIVSLVGTANALAAQPLPPNTPANAGSLSATVQQYQKKCSDAGGYFQYGTVNAPPNSDYKKVVNYKSGEKLKGIPLSHTHIEITSSLDGNVYDVAIDNVFASDYNKKKNVVPPSYASGIAANSTLYLCSGNPDKVPYSESENIASQGFDWVHTNCAASGYSSSFKNGFIYNDKGVNLTNNQQYCYLWP